MQNPIYVGVSGQISLERRMETIARNMANVNTTGFRSEEMKFESLVSPVARDNNQNVNFSSAGKTYISTNRGPVTQTGNPLDVARLIPQTAPRALLPTVQFIRIICR